MLATVKSFFGSRGVVAKEVSGQSASKSHNKRYAVLNTPIVRRAVIKGAAARSGYDTRQIELRLYVGKWTDKGGKHQAEVRAWCSSQRAGSGPIQVVDVSDVVDKVLAAASHKQYRDNAVLVAMKVLAAAGALNLQVPEPKS